MNQKIHLFWYSYKNLVVKPYPLLSKRNLSNLFGREKENYGDLLSKYVVEKVSQKKTTWYRPKTETPKTNLFAIGSILFYCDSKSLVWGSGIIEKNHPVRSCDVRAVRGPLTRRRLLELNIPCPEVYGDPALLLPEFYKIRGKKKIKLGVVPHFVDFELAKKIFSNRDDTKVIQLMTNDIEETTEEIGNCKLIISSSLHGLIVAHAYGIPAIWVKFSENLHGDNIKFQDYFQSVNWKGYRAETISKEISINEVFSMFEKYESIPDQRVIDQLVNSLKKSFPKL